MTPEESGRHRRRQAREYILDLAAECDRSRVPQVEPGVSAFSTIDPEVHAGLCRPIHKETDE